MLTEATGHVEIDVPRDREGTFEPVIVKKRQRRLNGVDEIVLSLYANGLTTGEISAHFAQIYGASVSKETVSRITDKVLEEMATWQARPLEEVYAAIFIDAIMVKVRDGQVANRPIYAAIGVTLTGGKDILGLWAGTGGEGAKFWMSVLTDIRNRGTKDAFFLVCDGLKGHQCRCRRACAVFLRRYLLDRRRQAEAGRHHRPLRILSAHPQSLSDRRGRAGVCGHAGRASAA